MRRKTTKLVAALAAVTVLLGAFGVAPAAADNPEPFPDSFSFPATNPCTGSGHFVTINVLVRVHRHKNTFVVNIKRSGTTSDGFVMRNGTENQHYNTRSSLAGAHFKDVWYNPSTGQKMHVRGNSTVVLGNGPDAPPTEIKTDIFSLRCVGAETLLP